MTKIFCSRRFAVISAEFTEKVVRALEGVLNAQQEGLSQVYQRIIRLEQLVTGVVSSKMDISVIFKLAAIGIIITIICQILKKSDRDDMAMVVSLIGLIIGLSVVISMISDFFTQIKQIFDIF